MTVWPGDKSQSPVDCVPDSNMELEGGAVVNGAQVDIEGMPGFVDDFSTLNTDNWPLNIDAYTENGLLKFQGPGTGFDVRHVGFLVANDEDFKNTTIEIENIQIGTSNDYALYAGFLVSNPTTGKNIYLYDYGNKVRVLLLGQIPFEFSFDRTLPFSLKFEVEKNLNLKFYLKQGQDYQFVYQACLETSFNINTFVIGQYHENKTFTVDKITVKGYPEKSVATVPKSDSFKPLLPANLASLGAITPILTGEKKPNTAIYLEGQIYNDDLLFQLQQINPDATKNDAWASFDGKIGEWTRLAELENGVPVLPPAMLKGLNGEFRPQIVFETDGVNQPQSFAGFSMVWGSDVLAPDAPTIISIAQDGAGAVVLKIVDVFPDDAVAAELEVNINNTGYKRVDVSNSLSLDSDYMKFIGSTSNVQKAGQINANFHTISGLQLGDTVKFKARYIDAVGNASPFIESEPITISGTQYVRVPVTKLKPKRKQKRIARWKK
jgi:hypothetical protein